MFAARSASSVISPRPNAFALIELCAVTTIIFILASLLLPAFSRVTALASETACRANLRQLALSLNLYTGDEECFPFWAVERQGTARFWHEAIRPYSKADWTNKLYKCPSYAGLTSSRCSAPFSDFGSYGYNKSGTDPNGGVIQPHGSVSSSLGLGNTILNGRVLPAVRESALRMPSDMIAIGDARVVRSWSQELVMMGLSGLFPAALPRGDSSGQEPVANRHNGRLAIAFCDGHVESLESATVTAANETARRRWNNDHEPHPETWLRQATW
jgi:prepilin-type processing-associated H-X9-DG protein